MLTKNVGLIPTEGVSIPIQAILGMFLDFARGLIGRAWTSLCHKEPLKQKYSLN